MTENKNLKARGVSINKPSDVRRIARRVISDIFQENSQIEHAGKINQLLQTWLKGWEAEKIEDLERRIKELEADTTRRRGR
ncbi:MAG: hypothetical protein J5I35_09740 [Methanothrix harundinacea]|nr:hypothetical protein [Methanothrix harundinacea]